MACLENCLPESFNLHLTVPLSTEAKETGGLSSSRGYLAIRMGYVDRIPLMNTRIMAGMWCCKLKLSTRTRHITLAGSALAASSEGTSESGQVIETRSSGYRLREISRPMSCYSDSIIPIKSLERTEYPTTCMNVHQSHFPHSSVFARDRR